MKKIIHIIACVAALTLASCEMDQQHSAGTEQSNAFSDMQTVRALMVGANSYLRSVYNPNSMIVPDIQSDYVHATNGFTNTFGNMYMWTFRTEADEVATTWNTCYAALAQINFILDGIEDNAKLEFEPTEDELFELDLMRGRLYLMRAMIYEMLVERFCADYDVATAKNPHTGVPMITSYDPSDLPMRASLHAIYELILENLKDAKTLLVTEKGAANSTTLNIDCVTAVEARVYLQMDNYESAYNSARSLISNSAYALVNSEEEFRNMWTYDRSSEVIFVFFASKNELPPAFGYYFGFDNYGGMEAMSLMVSDYIPTQTCVDQYESIDWRRSVYFLDCSISQPVGDRLYALQLRTGYYPKDLVILRKYPGNPELATSQAWSTNNSYKPLRLAEMYLIAAEAAAQQPDLGDAKTPLNELRKHRGLSELPNVTLAEVQQERYREMIAEGTRLTDLKRWGLGMKRGEPQAPPVTKNPGLPPDKIQFERKSSVTLLNATLQVEPTDDKAYMFIWPIPASDIASNPNLSGQQNPGWER